MPVEGTKPLLIELTDEMLPGDDVTQSHGRQYCSPQTRTRNDHRHEAEATLLVVGSAQASQIARMHSNCY